MPEIVQQIVINISERLKQRSYFNLKDTKSAEPLQTNLHYFYSES